MSPEEPIYNPADGLPKKRNKAFTITREQYFKNREKDFSEEIRSNATQLLAAVNILLADYAEWLFERDSVLAQQKIDLRSGIRTRAENKEIYRIINLRRFRQGLVAIPEATESSHLYGQGVDIADDHDLLKEYLETDRAKFIYDQLNLYFEDFSATDTWVHITTRAPQSGKRFFLP